MMSASSPMRPLVKIGHKPHAVDRQKYGSPYFALYWAGRSGFTYPGVYAWVWSRHFRVLPVPVRRG